MYVLQLDYLQGKNNQKTNWERILTLQFQHLEEKNKDTEKEHLEMVSIALIIRSPHQYSPAFLHSSSQRNVIVRSRQTLFSFCFWIGSAASHTFCRSFRCWCCSVLLVRLRGDGMNYQNLHFFTLLQNCFVVFQLIISAAHVYTYLYLFQARSDLWYENYCQWLQDTVVISHAHYLGTIAVVLSVQLSDDITCVSLSVS